MNIWSKHSQHCKRYKSVVVLVVVISVIPLKTNKQFPLLTCVKLSNQHPRLFKVSKQHPNSNFQKGSSLKVPLFSWIMEVENYPNLKGNSSPKGPRAHVPWLWEMGGRVPATKLSNQWSFLVPLIGGRWYIITQLAVYTTYILPIGLLYATYHLLREPGNSIDPTQLPVISCHFFF